MTKKKKQVKKEVIVATYHGDDPPKTLEELEKESDLARLEYLESMTLYYQAMKQSEIAERQMRALMERFNEVTCQYMAKKHGVDRKPRLPLWATELMAYAK